jgi:hypothetical protein
MTMLRKPDAVSNLRGWEDLTEVVSIGPLYNIAVSKASGDALLKQSLTEVYFIDRVILRENSLKVMVSNDYQGIDQALNLLATQDPDTCCAALEALDKIVNLAPTNGLTIPLDLILAHINNLILHATDAVVISKAQAVLADALMDSYLKLSFFALLTESQILSTLSKLEYLCLTAAPSNMQSALRLLSSFLDTAMHTYPTQRPTLLAQAARYIRLLRQTILDINPFDTRFAAAQSLTALSHIWSLSTSSLATRPIILALSLVLFDTLSDDDDEIRNLAARTTTTFLRAQGNLGAKDTVPLLASHRLATYLVHAFPTSRTFATEALRRLFDTRSLFSIPFADVLEQERNREAEFIRR